MTPSRSCQSCLRRRSVARLSPVSLPVPMSSCQDLVVVGFRRVVGDLVVVRIGAVLEEHARHAGMMRHTGRAVQAHFRIPAAADDRPNRNRCSRSRRRRAAPGQPRRIHRIACDRASGYREKQRCVSASQLRGPPLAVLLPGSSSRKRRTAAVRRRESPPHGRCRSRGQDVPTGSPARRSRVPVACPLSSGTQAASTNSQTRRSWHERPWTLQPLPEERDVRRAAAAPRLVAVLRQQVVGDRIHCRLQDVATQAAGERFIDQIKPRGAAVQRVVRGCATQSLSATARSRGTRHAEIPGWPRGR